jgi:hypothetical protein
MAPLLVKLLIEEITKQAGAQRNHQGFERVSEFIEDHTKPKEIKKGITHKELVSQKYLYETYKLVNKAIAENKPDVRTSKVKMDAIAEALGYETFVAFENLMIKPFDPMLEQCEGNWWSIVRANAGDFILKAPIRIYKSAIENKMMMEMKGGAHSYIGSIQLRAGNLFCDLSSKEDKIFYMIMKIGTNTHVRLLQGTFAGISSSGDPIAGRELFLKEEDKELKFDQMHWERLPLNTMKYQGNCLKVGLMSIHDLPDLELNY